MTAGSLLLEPFLWVLWFGLKESENQAGRRAAVISARAVLLRFTPAPVGGKGGSSL